MTQRAQLTGLLDRLAIDDLITGYARAVDDGDWPAYRALFTPDGRADYRGSGGIEGMAGDVSVWLEETMHLFPVRQHLIVNRQVHIESMDGEAGDGALVRADYINPMRLDTERGDSAAGGASARPDGIRPDPVRAASRRPDSVRLDGSGGALPAVPNLTSGGRYTFGLHRTDAGWRVHEVAVHEKWRRTSEDLVPQPR
ncbi:nuclear transport factor 2 family protein [Streptomyces sp. NPDC051776]|uniref:nuclear transport factor 2 family protein n=1 Tax=Streptomyces sp. NPDC051776 TaxID=3155414 RepID=UPI00342B49F8